MTDLRTTILDAAVQVFMRYGVGRTRMGDIATEAGVVRQTLYSFFKGKDEILCATIRHVSELSLAEIEHQWAHLDDLGDKLDVFYEQATISSFAVISASPDARDMIDGYNDAGKAEMLRVQGEKIAAWATQLRPYLLRDKPSTFSAEQLAEYIVLSSLGTRDLAGDEAQLRGLLAVQKAGILAMLAR